MREALAQHENLEMPFERGRTLLACGQVLRRHNERLTNRQIAERAYISLKTVEASLSRAYHKLGIQSRAQLAPAMLEREQGDQIHR